MCVCVCVIADFMSNNNNCICNWFLVYFSRNTLKDETETNTVFASDSKLLFLLLCFFQVLVVEKYMAGFVCNSS